MHYKRWQRAPGSHEPPTSIGRWDMLTWFALGERILTRKELGDALMKAAGYPPLEQTGR